MMKEAIDTAITAYSGTRWRFRRRKSPQPGIPRSRENAYHVREALVRPAAPQKNWPTVAMISAAFAAAGVRALEKAAAAVPPAAVTPLMSVTANRIASSSIHPAMAEKNTERHTPRAAAIAAPRVSSAVWADASYPVIVYMVRMKPSGIT